MKPLAIVPTYMRSAHDLLLLERCIETMRETAGPGVELMVIDDGSPDPELVEGARALCDRHDGFLHMKAENDGFATTVNIGLRRARESGQDALLVNADIEFDRTPYWLDRMVETDGDVIGALLLYPNGTIQHAGVFFSLLTRDFGHIFNHGPGNLPEAQVERECPVTAALHLIRNDTLHAVGIYDEEFRLGWEDVDYCIRVWQAGRKCIYQPRAIATHHEHYFRSRSNERILKWQMESWTRLAKKYAGVNFAQFVPNLTTEL